MRTLLAATLLFGLTACSKAEDIKPKSAKPTANPNMLNVGDPAPALAKMTWLNGEEVKNFAPGKVYVMDFWAIWCGPCIQAMPHLAELQAEYKDQGLIVFPVTTVTERNTVKQIEKFVTRRGGKLGFPFAVCNNNEMERTYFDAAGAEALPTSFVIDKQGKIAFIGHPMELDDVLPRVLDGTWKGETDLKAIKEIDTEFRSVVEKADQNPEAALKEFLAFETKYPAKAKQARVQSAKLYLALAAKKFDDAKALTEALLPKLIEHRNVGILNNFRSMWSDATLNPERKHMALVLTIANAVLKLEGETDPVALFGVAEAHFANGDKAKATEFIDKAIAVADNEALKKELQDQAKKYAK